MKYFHPPHHLFELLKLIHNYNIRMYILLQEFQLIKHSRNRRCSRGMLTTYSHYFQSPSAIFLYKVNDVSQLFLLCSNAKTAGKFIQSTSSCRTITSIIMLNYWIIIFNWNVLFIPNFITSEIQTMSIHHRTFLVGKNTTKDKLSI